MQLASPEELGTDTGGDVNACIRMRLPPLTPSPAETYSVVRVTSQDQPAVGHPHMLRTPHPQGRPKVPRGGDEANRLRHILLHHLRSSLQAAAGSIDEPSISHRRIPQDTSFVARSPHGGIIRRGHG